MTGTEKQSRPPIQRLKVGVVRSISGKQTISVLVTTQVKHPRYGKYVRRRTKVAVHDPQEAAGVGDVVEIVPCRRLSKSKAWRLMRIVRRASVVEGE